MEENNEEFIYFICFTKTLNLKSYHYTHSAYEEKEIKTSISNEISRLVCIWLQICEFLTSPHLIIMLSLYLISSMVWSKLFPDFFLL